MNPNFPASVQSSHEECAQGNVKTFRVLMWRWVSLQGFKSWSQSGLDDGLKLVNKFLGSALSWKAGGICDTWSLERDCPEIQH